MNKNQVLIFLLSILSSIAFSSCSRNSSRYVSELAKKKRQESPKKSKQESDEKKPRSSRKTSSRSDILYMGTINTGVYSKDYRFKEVSFDGLKIANGITRNNIFLGLETGIDFLDSISNVPLGLSTRFTFSSKKEMSNSSRYKNWLNTFVFVNAGLVDFRNKGTDPLHKGYYLYPGLGFLFGRSQDSRLSISAGYKYQIFNKIKTSETFHVRLGVEFSPWLKNRGVTKI